MTLALFTAFPYNRNSKIKGYAVMRMRKKKNLETRVAACGELLIEQPDKYRCRWAEQTCGRPVWLEIGCGKGAFSVACAGENPDRFLVGVERERNVMVLALEKAREAALANLCFLNMEAARLGEVFAPGEVQRIFLNFSDPWLGNRNAKRRLTFGKMLELYAEILEEDGTIQLKTDNDKLFDYSLCQLTQHGFMIQMMIWDLHSSEQHNLETEYEAKFVSQNIKIHFLIAKRKKSDKAGNNKLEAADPID